MRYFKPFIFLLLLMMAAGTVGPAVSAAGPAQPAHEDPAIAQQIYSSISLLRYYSISLDFMIQKDAAGSKANLQQMPFANIPPELDQPTTDFAGSGTSFTDSLVGLFSLWDQESSYVKEYRLQDAAAAFQQITAGLPQARQELTTLEYAVKQTADYMKIDSLPDQNPLKLVYNEVEAKIQQLRAMLDMLAKPLLPPDILSKLTPEQLAKLLPPEIVSKLTPEQLQNLTPEQLAQLLPPDIVSKLTPDQLAQLLSPTAITFIIDPTTAFVGDSVNFQGTLTSKGTAMAGRDIAILLNDTDYIHVTTDSGGNFSGTMTIPYQYVHEMTAQAIYYPKANDSGVYLAATSDVVKLNILFYEATLTLTADEPAYPGRTAVVNGKFEYIDLKSQNSNGKSTTQNSNLTQNSELETRPLTRTVQILFDNKSEGTVNAGTDFTYNLSLDPQTATGLHPLEAAAQADGRYAPVYGSFNLDVEMAATVIKITQISKFTLIPGSMEIQGRVYSVLGPENGAAVELKSQISNLKTTDKISNLTTQNFATTDNEGKFTLKLSFGEGLSLLGNQTLSLEVTPKEPWNAPAGMSRSLFLINYLNILLILAALAGAAIYIPRLMKKWGMTQRKKDTVLPKPVIPEAQPVQLRKEPEPVRDGKKAGDEEKTNPVVYWYRTALAFVQNLTRSVLRPNQTLREYAAAAGRALGPAGKLFMELTLMVERRLYSPGSKEEDAERSKTLAEELKTKKSNLKNTDQI